MKPREIRKLVREFDFFIAQATLMPEIAQKFGGGGHIRAAGCTVNKDDLLNETDRLVSLLLAKIGNPRTKWIM